MEFFLSLENQGQHFSAHLRHTHNPLNGEVVDLLASVGPEELPVLPADLLATTRQKERQKESVSGSSVGGEALGGR